MAEKRFNVKVVFKEEDIDQDEAIQTMVDDGISLKNAKSFFEKGSFSYETPKDADFVEDLREKYGKVAEIVAEEVPFSTEELIEDYVETNKDKLRGKAGESAPKLPWILCAIGVCVFMLIAGYLLHTWQPIDVQRANSAFNESAKAYATQIFDQKEAAKAEIKQDKQAALAEVDQAKAVAIAEINAAKGSVQPGIQKPGGENKKETPQGTSEFTPGYVPRVVPGK